MHPKGSTYSRKYVDRVCQTCNETFPARTDGKGLYCSRLCQRRRSPRTPEVLAERAENKRTRERAYYAANREALKAKREDPATKERTREAARRRYWSNRDAMLVKLQEAAAKSSGSRRAYRIRNLARYAALTKMWRQKNPDQYASLASKSVAKKHGLTEHFTGQEWADLKRACGYRCLRCERSEPAIKLTVDHIVPMDLKGHNTIANIQPLCGPCNTSKHARAIDYRFQLMQHPYTPL